MKKGFTLIELLIVIAIITILALIAIPNFIEAQTRAAVSRVQADMRNTATAVESYFLDYNAYPYATYFWDHPVYIWNSSTKITQGTTAICRGVALGTSLMWFTGLTTPLAYMTALPYIDPLQGNSKAYFWLSGTSDGAVAGWPHIQFANFSGARKFRSTGDVWWSGSSTSTPASFWDKLDAAAPLRFNSSNTTEFGVAANNLGNKDWTKSGSRQYNSTWSLCSAGPDRSFTENRNSYPSESQNVAGVPRVTNSMYMLLVGDSNFYDPSNGSKSAGNIWRFAGTSDR